jgi:hypothetical protein
MCHPSVVRSPQLMGHDEGNILKYQGHRERRRALSLKAMECAFSFCWWAGAALALPAWELSEDAAQPPHEVQGQEELVVVPMVGMGEKKWPHPQRQRGAQHLAPGLTPRPGVAGARDHAVALLARMVGQGPTACLATAPGLAVGEACDRSLYPVTTNYCYRRAKRCCATRRRR